MSIAAISNLAESQLTEAKLTLKLAEECECRKTPAAPPTKEGRQKASALGPCRSVP